MGDGSVLAQLRSDLGTAVRDRDLPPRRHAELRQPGVGLLPPALYFGIHLIEGEALTPMLVARRFALDPVLVILALVFWFWMWGVPGAILAVPILAILKIVCDRVRALKALGHFLEG